MFEVYACFRGTYPPLESFAMKVQLLVPASEVGRQHYLRLLVFGGVGGLSSASFTSGGVGSGFSSTGFSGSTSSSASVISGPGAMSCCGTSGATASGASSIVIAAGGSGSGAASSAAVPQALLATAAGPSPFQRSVCTNPTSGSSIAKFSINRQPDGGCYRDRALSCLWWYGQMSASVGMTL